MMKPWSRFLLPAVLALWLPGLGSAQITVDVSANVPPPELPVYDQPPIPGDGYVWTPGYWAWSDDDQDYYWVPGTWVPAPQPEYLWTPGYWGVSGALFLWHPGYWGPHVGFYGGVNYGYGYAGNGYEGGYWQGGRMYYNRSVNNINNVNITNVYNKTVVNNVTVNRISYNGGNGVHAQPTPEQIAAAREPHIQPTAQQRQHVELARRDMTLHASQNQGRPPIAATPKPAAFTGAGVVSARQGGTFSVVHQNPAPRENQPDRAPAPHPPAPRTTQEPMREQPREQPRYDAPRPPPEPRREAQPPPQAPHPAAPPPPPPPPPQAPHPAAPPPHAPPPAHPERPPERERDH
jgi:YXWGXW repeat-containing protein